MLKIELKCINRRMNLFLVHKVGEVAMVSLVERSDRYATERGPGRGMDRQTVLFIFPATPNVGLY